MCDTPFKNTTETFESYCNNNKNYCSFLEKNGFNKDNLVNLSLGNDIILMGSDDDTIFQSFLDNNDSKFFNSIVSLDNGKTDTNNSFINETLCSYNGKQKIGENVKIKLPNEKSIILKKVNFCLKNYEPENLLFVNSSPGSCNGSNSCSQTICQSNCSSCQYENYRCKNC